MWFCYRNIVLVLGYICLLGFFFGVDIGYRVLGKYGYYFGVFWGIGLIEYIG